MMPAGLQQEYEAAVSRTGMTRALETAELILPYLLSASPIDVEYFMRIPYQHMDRSDNLVVDTMEEIVLVSEQY